MELIKLNLQLFAGGHNVTVVKDDGVSAASASSTSDVQANAEVTLTVTFASGYELDKYDVITGGVTVDPSTKKFTMGSKDVVIAVKSKGSKTYMVTENCYYGVNGTFGKLTRNMKLVIGPNGQIVGVDCAGTDLTSMSADLIANMVASGVLVKI